MSIPKQNGDNSNAESGLMAEVSPQESILHQRRDAINLFIPHTSKLTLPPSPLSSSAQAFYNNVGVKQVDVSSTTGSFGILPDHVPIVAVLKPGILNVYENESTTSKFFGECLLNL